MMLFKRLFAVIAVTLCVFGTCSMTSPRPLYADDEKEVPIINFAWDFDHHSASLLAAVVKGDAFKDSGYYFKCIVGKQQYELYKGNEKIALINTIVTKGSSETAVMMGQGRINCCVNSSTGMMSGYDQGTDIQMLCPIHVDGISLVFAPESKVYGWEAVEKTIKESPTPFRIGFHAPTSAPRVLVQAALERSGLKVTLDPNDENADVVLVNLNGSKNLLSSLTNDIVDAWTGPSHHPELAENMGFGKIALKLKDFPPQGQWLDFPCCVFAAHERVVKENPEVLQGLVALLTWSADWCQNNRKEAAPILAEIIGIPEDVVNKAEIVFTTRPTEKWLEGEALYVEMLNRLGLFDGRMKGKTFANVKDVIFNFQFINNVK